MRLLLVEDEPDIASFIKKSLEEEDYKVTVAMDGTMAWEYINSIFICHLLYFLCFCPFL